MIDVALLAALVVITTWATAATGFATLCWLKMRRALARIALLEDAIVELKSRPCLAPCAALLQREQTSPTCRRRCARSRVALRRWKIDSRAR